MIVVDSSALIAIFQKEADASVYAAAIHGGESKSGQLLGRNATLCVYSVLNKTYIGINRRYPHEAAFVIQTKIYARAAGLCCIKRLGVSKISSKIPLIPEIN